MNSIMILEKKAKEFLLENKLNIVKKLSWHARGFLCTIRDEQGNQKSLYCAFVEQKFYERIHFFYEIMEESKTNEDMIKCERIEKITETCKGEEAKIIFVIMEEIVPLIIAVLDEQIPLNNKGKNERQFFVISKILESYHRIEQVGERWPDLGLYINREEICLTKEQQPKLILFDLICNEVATSIWEKELYLIHKQISTYLKLPMEKFDETKSTAEYVELLKETCNELEQNIESEKELFQQLYQKATKGNAKYFYDLGYMYEKGRGCDINYKEALDWYQKAAKRKDSKAYNNMAYLYQKGFGVEKDREKAVSLLLEAAKKGDALAQFNLGIAYQTGKGVEKNLETAMAWYKKSMKKGNEQAKRMYGRIKDTLSKREEK